MTATTAPRLRLDRSRPFATVHGERAPGDPHQSVHFAQDGIHFDAQGLHLDDLIEDEKVRALVDKRLKRQIKAAPAAETAESTDASDDADETEQSGSDPAGDVNLDAWLRGDAKYPWFAITKAVRERYHQNLTRLVDVLEFLVFDLKVITEAELDGELKKQLRPQG